MLYYNEQFKLVKQATCNHHLGCTNRTQNNTTLAGHVYLQWLYNSISWSIARVCHVTVPPRQSLVSDAEVSLSVESELVSLSRDVAPTPDNSVDLADDGWWRCTSSAPRHTKHQLNPTLLNPTQVNSTLVYSSQLLKLLWQRLINCAAIETDWADPAYSQLTQTTCQ